MLCSEAEIGTAEPVEPDQVDACGGNKVIRPHRPLPCSLS